MKKNIIFLSFLFIVFFSRGVLAAVVSCNPGTYWNGNTCAVCSSQYYCEGFTNINNPARNYGRTRCPTGYRSGGTGLTSINECALKTTSGRYIATAYSTTQTTCTAGYYCPSTLIGYGNTGNRIICTGYTYSGSGASSCTNCPNGYRDNTTDGKTSSSQCQVNTTGGTYISSAYATSLSTCTSGYYCPSSWINYGSTGTRTACPSGYTSGGTGLALQSDCKLQTTNGNYIATAYSTTQTTCTAGYYCPASLIGYGSTGTIIQCTGATYSAAGASSCTNCPASYTANISAAKTSVSQCQIQTTDGNYIATAYSTTQTTCTAGYYCPASLVNYGNTGEIIQCSAGTYSGASASSCISCAIGSYNTTNGATSCIACQNGTTTNSIGQSICNTDCSNNNNYDTSWVAANWNAGNTVTNLCTINGCAGGYYLATDTCVDVGLNYWSADGSVTRTLCDTGLTTIGFGPGADEPSDCGHVMNVGGTQLHLRSEKKTSPSLYLQINGSTYYGNMTTDIKGSMRANYNGINYSIYDDSM